MTTRSPAEHATTAYLLYDDRNLYVGFRAEQTGTPVTATQTTNDVGFGIDDFLGIGIDSSGSGSQAYFFETTPRGVRYQQANENVRYRPRWESAATTDGKGGWSAVMIVPLSVLKLDGGSTWHLQFVRAVAARGEHYAWAYNGIMQDAAAGTWPTFADTRWWASGTDLKLAGFRTRPKARADAYGLASLGGDRTLFEQSNGAFLPMKLRNEGLDASIPLTPTISFVGTANPDFSNVEIDQQTIAPQEFRRQLVEYRPFFAQGANFINASSGSRTPSGQITTPPNLIFYSPDIGPFFWGAKTEGTFEKNSFGALTFRGFDQVTGDTFSDQAYGFQHAEPDGTFYYWSDGVLAHHSLAGNDSTIEGGIQSRNYHTGLVLLGDYAFENGSWLPEGHADFAQVSADVHRPNFEIYTSYLDTSPNYNPIDGFTPNSDIRGPMTFVNFVGSTPGIKNWSLFTEADRFVDESGAAHQADMQMFANATFKNGFSLDGVGFQTGQLRSYGIPAGPGCSGPIVGTSYYSGYPCYLNGATAPFDLGQVAIGYGDGTPSPIDALYSWGPFGGNSTHLFNLSTTRPITRTMTLGLTYDGTYQRSLTTGALDSQWLRSISLGINLSNESTLTLALRDINGYGGFATQIGNNLAIAFHDRFRSGSEIFVNYGSPAAGATINRLIVKYVFHAGADA
ncbi:MAG TPA: hypothetical protein VKR05_05155, partial [Candidatus Cybelea sp.]|nr:hypothetical protein [Candidatus Cybelea sp.]